MYGNIQKKHSDEHSRVEGHIGRTIPAGPSKYATLRIGIFNLFSVKAVWFSVMLESLRRISVATCNLSYSNVIPASLTIRLVRNNGFGSSNNGFLYYGTCLIVSDMIVWAKSVLLTHNPF